jgi:integrase
MKMLSEYIRDMLLYKESIGYSKKTYEYDLMRFCKFMTENQLEVSDLKEEVVLGWCSRWESESQTSARRRVQPVRELLKYLSAIGVDCFVIPSGFLPRPEIRTPYIFTDRELQYIFKQCDELSPNQNSPTRHLILPVLLRLIFFCGLRPKEGRELQSSDIDFDRGILLIRKSKSHKERYVAMSDDVLQMCNKYRSAVANVAVDNTYFFPSMDGTPFNRRWLSGQFRTLWHKARAVGNESSAVVYDLRHRHATTVMMKWLDEGADLNAKLPYLSSYMGHTHFSDTAYYIHLLPENLVRSAAIDWSHFSDLIPEVAEDE